MVITLSGGNKGGNNFGLKDPGEGIAEAIARQIIERAIEDGAQLDPPPTEPKEIGKDRDRQGLFQMIHVSKDRLRVLVRA